MEQTYPTYESTVISEAAELIADNSSESMSTISSGPEVATTQSQFDQLEAAIKITLPETFTMDEYRRLKDNDESNIPADLRQYVDQVYRPAAVDAQLMARQRAIEIIDTLLAREMSANELYQDFSRRMAYMPGYLAGEVNQIALYAGPTDIPSLDEVQVNNYVAAAESLLSLMQRLGQEAAALRDASELIDTAYRTLEKSTEFINRCVEQATAHEEAMVAYRNLHPDPQLEFVAAEQPPATAGENGSAAEIEVAPEITDNPYDRGVIGLTLRPPAKKPALRIPLATKNRLKR